MAERNSFFSVAEFQQALGDSEKRRKVLLQSIQEIQETMRVQSLQLDEKEAIIKEYQRERDKVKNKERDYQRYITNLERQLLIGKQRLEGQMRILQDAEIKFEQLEEEASTLRSAVTRLEGECKCKEDKLKACSSKLRELEEENASLVVEVESANQKLLVQLETLASLREDNAFLDKQAKSEAVDAERLRTENASLFSDVKQLRKQVTMLCEKSSLSTKEIALLTTQLQTSNAEEKRLKGQVSELQKVNNDLRELISNFTNEKDRFFREKLDFCTQIQNLSVEKDTLFRVRPSNSVKGRSFLQSEIQHLLERLLADDEANELSSDLAQMKRMVNKLTEENKRLTEELNAIRKVPYSQFADVRYASTLDQRKDQGHSAEQNKRTTFQEDDLYKDEIRSLEQQIIDYQDMLTTAKNDSDWALVVQDDLIEKLQNEVAKLREEKYNLQWILDKQRELSETENQQRELEFICRCRGKEECEDMCARRSRNEGHEDFYAEFDGRPRQDDASAYSFSGGNSSFANVPQMTHIPSTKKEILSKSSNKPVEDIFCGSWYADNNRCMERIQLSPTFSDRRVRSEFKRTEVDPNDFVSACIPSSVGVKERKETLAVDETTGEDAAITDVRNDGGPRAKERDERRVETIDDLKTNFCSDGGAEPLNANDSEKENLEDDPKETVTVNSFCTKALKQEDVVNSMEENSKMEIYVCLTDDQDEKFFEEGSAAYLVLLPPNSKDISVISDNAVNFEHHETVTDNRAADDKNGSRPQTNLSGENTVENKTHTPDIQIIRLSSNENEIFRKSFIGQNALSEANSSGIPIFGAIELSARSERRKNFASAFPKPVKDTDRSQAGDDNKVRISKEGAVERQSTDTETM